MSGGLLFASVLGLPAAVRAGELSPALVSSGTYASIANTTQSAPGQSARFTSFSYAGPVLSGSNVAFSAVYSGGNGYNYSGVYTGVAGTSGATRIADLSTTAPGQGSVFYDFATPAVSGSHVVFTAEYNAANDRGVYTGVAGTSGASRIADTSITAPGQSTVFNNFLNPAISGSNVVFRAQYNSGKGEGIYTGVAGTSGATRVADTSMTAPGQSTTFYNFADVPAISGSNVVFYAQYNGGNGRGIYTGVTGTSGATRIADTSITAPGQSSVFNNFGSPAISGSNVAFGGDFNNYNGGNYTGIYTGTAGVGGAARIADNSMTAPGQSSAFSTFGAPAISGSNVAFTGQYNGGNSAGVYTGVVGASGVSRIADFSTTVPGQSVAFFGFGTPTVSGSTVAFDGYYNNFTGHGIFLYNNGTLSDVAETGEALFGSTISSLSFNSPGLDGNDLTFSYTLANGVSGIASVVIPEPATWLGGGLLAAAAGLTLRRRPPRRR